MKKLGNALLIIGCSALIVNILGTIISESNLLFISKVEPAFSLDGKVINLFLEIGAVTYISLLLTVCGYVVRRKYA